MIDIGPATNGTLLDRLKMKDGRSVSEHLDEAVRVVMDYNAQNTKEGEPRLIFLASSLEPIQGELFDVWHFTNVESQAMPIVLEGMLDAAKSRLMTTSIDGIKVPSGARMGNA